MKEIIEELRKIQSQLERIISLLENMQVPTGAKNIIGKEDVLSSTSDLREYLVQLVGIKPEAIDVVQRGDFFIVKLKQFVGSDVFGILLRAIRKLGGEYSNREFRIPIEQ